ncbi:MAG TPA: tRNA lysidine(34) synthetase TilS [Flavobacteriales bacterium]|nr:tRNA lysidine(34) synthetase TilS [Flavobacteriales bacterium]
MIAERVHRTLLRHRMLEPGQPILVAVSGGVDSMVLLHVLQRLGHPITVLHVDHGLRGAESDADRSFVEEQARRCGWPCQSVRLDVRAEAAKPGVSIQMAARELRYAWFRERMNALGVPVLATAHHRDDAIETLLLNMLRGAGRQGFMGLPPTRNGIVRPLIEVSRQDIEAFAREQGIAFRDDPSNRDPAYLRNRVRHELLPLLEALHPGARQSLGRATVMLRELGGLTDMALTRELELRVKPLGLPLSDIRESDHPHALLAAFMQDHPLHPDRVEQVLDSLEAGGSGRCFPVEGGAWLLDREHLRWMPERRPVATIELGKDLELSPEAPVEARRMTSGDLPAHFGPDDVWLDEDRLAFPLVLRPWRSGDRIRPLGMTGSRLVSDVLTDAKVPLDVKASVRVLESRGTLVWVCGYRLAEGFQADAGSRSVVRIVLR